MVDFERLNGGDVRLTIVAVDVTTGEEVHFDTDKVRLGPDHLLACSGFIPFFPPVEMDGRLLGDGGMAANLPLEAALEEPSDEDRLCIAIDLFRRSGGRPRTVGQAMDRQLDLLLSSQSAQAVRSLRRVHELRRHLRRLGERLPEGRRGDADVASALAEGAKDGDGATTLLLLSLAPVSRDVELRAFDYSRPVLAERWDAGRAAMEAALRGLDGQRAAPGEFAVRLAGGEAAGVQ
ncbi:putative acylesterase/phospholipase RssA [Azospirillum rugosum]|uniref:Acylesterase/phospholipase RssA n=1 Tax=Azospirillum rugosum TaxID=416170 RepID=A0ABS4SJ17_9PROT|nr:patatin-like phospholipase family protein [Azospirillum rugosum]MBP2292475.1 putative acylesterase/phospholipase RssA [Azospirillum rugosum]MDQ0526234.1 putative acylesterase/phospholipase RssA [Azospirillum rugosum]